MLPPRNPVHPPEANGGMATTIYMYMLLTKPLHINSYTKHRKTLMNIESSWRDVMQNVRARLDPAKLAGFKLT